MAPPLIPVLQHIFSHSRVPVHSLMTVTFMLLQIPGQTQIYRYKDCFQEPCNSIFRWFSRKSTKSSFTQGSSLCCTPISHRLDYN